MTIFGYKIETRFWIFLGLALIVLVALLFVSRQNKPFDPLNTPSFPTADLATAAGSDTWIDPYLKAYGLEAVTESGQLTSLSDNLGQPLRAKLLLPAEELSRAERPDLLINSSGWSFFPALFLDPGESLSAEALAEKGSELASELPIMVGFPTGAAPALRNSSQALEITGLLYGQSQLISPDASLAPVFLASEYRPLSDLEVASPATHRADLNITYARGPVQTTVRSIEWSSGKEVRICVEVSNLGSGSFNAADKVAGAVARYATSGGQADNALTEPDPESTLTTNPDIRANGQASGFLSFGPPLAGPEQGLTLLLPGTEINVAGRQFKEISSAAATTGGCSDI